MARAADNPDPTRFESDIRAFELADNRTPPPDYPILFVGSSSIRRWANLPNAFPEFDVLNRGFGGSHLSDVLHYFDRLVLPYHPPLIVLYEGDNDLAGGKSVDQVFADWTNFVGRVETSLPDSDIAFLAVKPSPSRLNQLPTQTELNRRIQEFCERDPDLRYFDVATPLLDTEGQPRRELFVEDLLHLNDDGYALWRAAIAPELNAWADTSPYPVRKPQTGGLLVDFGADASPTGGETGEPQIERWNNLTVSVASSSSGRLPTLVTVDGHPSTVSLAMRTRFNGANENGTTASSLYPASATRDSLYGNTEAFNGIANVFPSFALEGLDPMVAYRLTFYASRLGVSDNRQTRYTLTGATTLATDLDPANNLDAVASINGIQPSAEGTLLIALTPGPENNNGNHFTYLGVLRVDADGPGGPSFLIDAGATGSPTSAEPVRASMQWNNVTVALGTTHDGELPTLVSTNGEPTGIALRMISRFNAANQNGSVDSPHFPASATGDSLFGNSAAFNGLEEVAPQFKLTGLNPGGTYRLGFFASRTGVSDHRETRYTVTGATTQSADLEVANNSGQLAWIDGVTPDAGGAVAVALTPGPNNDNANRFTYLGVLQIDWVIPPPKPRPALADPALVPGHFRVRLQGTVGSTYTLQQSSDLSAWADLQTLTLEAPSATVDVPVLIPAGRSYFRSRE